MEMAGIDVRHQEAMQIVWQTVSSKLGKIRLEIHLEILFEVALVVSDWSRRAKHYK